MKASISERQSNTLVKNCDIVFFDNLILNVSKFDHPGGAAILKNKSGLDITHSFNEQKHSLNAKIMLRDLAIGEIEGKTSTHELFTQSETKIVNTYDSIRQKLDLSKPLRDQVSKMTRQQFLVFLNYPKFIKEGQEIRLNTDLVDDLPDKTQFWVNIPILTVIWFVLIYLSLLLCENIRDFVIFIICFAIAVLKWTIIQYYFHRIKLHRQLNLAENASSSQFVQLAKSHLIHHAFPNYPKSIAIQLKTVCSHIAVFMTVYTLLFGVKIALFVTVGLIFCAVAYDCLHYFFHFGWEPQWEFIANLKRNHLKHHYRNTDRGFGVTSTLWDKILGTQHY